MKRVPTFVLVAFFTSCAMFRAHGQELNPLNSVDQGRVDSLKIELDREGRSEISVQQLHLELANIFGDYNVDSTNYYASKVLNAHKQFPDLILEAKVAINWSVEKLENDFESAANTWEILLNQARSLEKGALVSEILNALALCHDFLGRYQEAERAYLESLKVAKDHGVPKGKWSATYANLSDHYFERGLFELAEKYQLMALEIDLAVDNKAYVAQEYAKLGDIYSARSELGKALAYYYKSRDLYMKINDKRGEIWSWMTIGSIHEMMDEDSLAMEFFESAISLSEVSNDQLNLMDSYADKAHLLTKMGQYAKAINFLERSLSIAKSINYEIAIAENLIGLAENKRLLGLQEDALNYAQSGMVMSREIGAQSVFLRSVLEMANIFTSLSNPREAQVMLSLALPLADSLGELAVKLDAVNLLADLQYQQGAFREALENRVLQSQLQDSIRRLEDVRTLRRLELENTFENEKDSMARVGEVNSLYRMASLAEKKADTRNMIILLVLSLIMMILFYVSYKAKKEAQFKLSLLHTDLKNQYDDLDKINKAKTKFFAIIAHDLRGPMGAFTGFYQLLGNHLGQRYSQDNQFRRLSGKVQKSSGQILDLLDNLLKWALNEQGGMPHKPQLLDLSDCVKEAMEILESQITLKSLRSNVDIPAGTNVFADKNSLLTIVRNLVSNSIKFSQEGGAIDVIASPLEGSVAIRIKDTGVGMSEDQLENLFQFGKESSTDGTKGEKGTGLGLRLVFDFVKKNDGSIHVESSQGVGTTFTVTLPAREGS